MARKPHTWVVDLRHYLSEETEDLADMPGPAPNCAMLYIDCGLGDEPFSRRRSPHECLVHAPTEPETLRW